MSLGQQTPMLKLDYDLLCEIFQKIDSLDVLRHSSQVCWNWREILLESPSLWGRNIDLDALRQKSDKWRYLVLRRTGQAMLSISGYKTIISDTILFHFVALTLEVHWTRIRDLKINVKLVESDHQRIWRAFGRPAPNLQTFSFTTVSYIAGWSHWNVLSPDFQLFSKHAQSLLVLHVDPMFPFNPDITTPTLFNKNLRSLVLTWPLVLKDTDLLTACKQMPLIEQLSLYLAQFVRSPPSEIDASLLIPLPKLKLIKIAKADPGVYPAFLDHILPAADCTLKIHHEFDAWSTLEPDVSKTADVTHMHRIMGRYADSYFEHTRTFNMSGIWLRNTQHGFDFALNNFGPYGSFQITASDESHTHNNILLALLDSLATFKFSRNNRRLRLDLGRRDEFLARSPSFEAFNSMNSVIELETSMNEILYLGRFPRHETLFPNLETISLKTSLSYQPHSIESVFQFLLSRHQTTPVKVLEFTGFSWPLGDWRILNSLSGLKVLWQSRSGNSARYVCGSGDPQKLLLI